MQKELKRHRPSVICTSGWTALLVGYDYPQCWPPLQMLQTPHRWRKKSGGTMANPSRPLPFLFLSPPFPLFLLSLPVEVGPIAARDMEECLGSRSWSGRSIVYFGHQFAPFWLPNGCVYSLLCIKNVSVIFVMLEKYDSL